jgi:hypothetical protein
MSRGAHKFKPGYITKALKAAVNAGLTVKRYEYEFETGKIVVFTGPPEDPPDPANDRDGVRSDADLDRELAEFIHDKG